MVYSSMPLHWWVDADHIRYSSLTESPRKRNVRSLQRPLYPTHLILSRRERYDVRFVGLVGGPGMFRVRDFLLMQMPLERIQDFRFQGKETDSRTPAVLSRAAEGRRKPLLISFSTKSEACL